MDLRWQGDPLAAFGNGFEYAAPLVTADKVPDHVAKLKGLGNAIVPQVAYVIFATIQEDEG